MSKFETLVMSAFRQMSSISAGKREVTGATLYNVAQTLDQVFDEGVRNRGIPIETVRYIWNAYHYVMHATLFLCIDGKRTRRVDDQVDNAMATLKGLVWAASEHF